ncbi:unnamed protein product [Schistocephalus solidus]|uniref:TANC2 n=1 Tax=Schistocephalus solidus TaxID=70667 RepID=A0A183ST77_SCHSO|nr:unnamed protein product [Schistocephalus solidus]
MRGPTCYANDLNFDGSLRTSPFAAAVASRPVLYDFQKYSSGISRSTPHSGTTITYPMPKKTEPQTRPPYQSSTRSSKPLSTSSYSLRMGNESGNHLSRTKSIPHLGCPPRNNVYDHSYHREMELKSTFPPSRKQETSQFSYYPSSPARSRDVVAKMSNLTLRDNSCSRVQAFQNGYVSNIRSPSCSASESRYRCPSTSDDYMDGRRTVYHPPLNVNNASTAYYEPESSVSGSRRSSNTQGGLVGLSNLGNTTTVQVGQLSDVKVGALADGWGTRLRTPQHNLAFITHTPGLTISGDMEEPSLSASQCTGQPLDTQNIR